MLRLHAGRVLVLQIRNVRLHSLYELHLLRLRLRPLEALHVQQVVLVLREDLLPVVCVVDDISSNIGDAFVAAVVRKRGLRVDRRQLVLGHPLLLRLGAQVVVDHAVPKISTIRIWLRR